MAIGLAILAAIGGAVLLWRAAVRPERLLYAMAFVVSFVGVNVHVGFTIYLSRLVLLVFLAGLAVRWLAGSQGGLQLRCDLRVLGLFTATLLVQIWSALGSERVADSLRQVLIYLGAMSVFVLVVTLADNTEKIRRALRYYLAAGVVQGLYGIYQVIGGPHRWPTYQTLMAGIPTANDRSDGGYYFTNGYNIFRSMGFFPGDVSHYAGYLAGVLLIAIALLMSRRGIMLPVVVLLICGLGLLLSLSRSGILAFAMIGLPVLAYFLSSNGFVRVRRPFSTVAKTAGVVALVGVLLAGFSGGRWLTAVDFGKVRDVLGSRLLNLVQSDNSPGFESMEVHIRTRLLALDAFVTHPLLGVGLGITATPWYSIKYQEPWYGAHSHHFNILGETGLIGATLEWVFMGLVMVQLTRSVRWSRRGSDEQIMAIALVAAYVTIILGNFFYAYYTNDFVWFIMGAGWALSRLTRRDARERDHARSLQAVSASQQ